MVIYEARREVPKNEPCQSLASELLSAKPLINKYLQLTVQSVYLMMQAQAANMTVKIQPSPGADARPAAVYFIPPTCPLSLPLENKHWEGRN